MPGASDEVLKQFVAEIARPMSGAEVRATNSSQRNPFPRGDPLHLAWHAFDASKWVIPSRPLPPSYLSFLRSSNGGEFRTGERWFQFFPALDRQHGVRAMMLGYHLPEYMPGAVPIAFDGCGGFYLLDCPTREEALAIARRCPAAEWATVEVRETAPCYL